MCTDTIDGAGICPNFSPEDRVCTLPVGHGGAHRAEDEHGHVLEEWHHTALYRSDDPDPPCKEECRKHLHAGYKVCDATDEDSYACTRLAGHSGPHVACGLNAHAIRMWP